MDKQHIIEIRELARTGKGEVRFTAADMRELCDLALIGAALIPEPQGLHWLGDIGPEKNGCTMYFETEKQCVGFIDLLVERLPNQFAGNSIFGPAPSP